MLFIQKTKYVIEKCLIIQRNFFVINVGFAKSLLNVDHNFLVSSIP